MLKMDESGGSIAENHGAAELVLLRFASSSVEEAAFNSRFKMVAEDTVSGLEHS